MKQALFVVVTAFTLASCGNVGNDEATKSNTTEGFAAPEGGDGGQPVDYGNTLISLTEANTWIDNYHNYVDFKNDSTQALSFMLNARKLKEYLNSDSSLEKLDIYLARTGRGANGQMRLVYVGARNVGTADSPIYQEIPIIVDGAENMLDHAIPCPTCDRDPLHTPPSVSK
jgi:hypothetical protein